MSPSLVSVDLSYLALDSRKVCKELAAMVASNSTLVGGVGWVGAGVLEAIRSQ